MPELLVIIGEALSTLGDPAQAAWENLEAREVATAGVDSPGAVSKMERAFALVSLDEVNLLRAAVGTTRIGSASQVWDPANMANATGVTSPAFTVPGAAFGDEVVPLAPYTLAGVIAMAYVSAANTVVIRLHNGTGAAANLASGTWSVLVRRPTALAARTPAQLKTAVKAKINDGTADT